MKLLSINLWGGRLEAQVAELMTTENPDIICMQEATHVVGGKAAFFITVEEIQALLKADNLFMSPTLSFSYMNRKADYGNAIVSRFPVVEQNTIFTGGEYSAEFDRSERGGNIRNLQHAQIEVSPGKLVHVLNHHGHHIHEHKNGDPETMRQCRIIADYVAKLEGDIILTGDFNLSPNSESLQQISKHLKNLSVEAGLKTTRTNLTHKTEVCDFIFVSDSLNVSDFRPSEIIASDHKALILEWS